MNNKIIAAIALLAVLAIGLSSLMPAPKPNVEVGGASIPFQLPDLEGQLHGLPQGKVVLLNFWATWCPPCRKEVPSMVKLYEQFKDQGFEIVAVSVDRSKSDVVSFVKEQNMTFTVLHDMDSTVSHEYGVFRYPETFILDKNGVVRQHLSGAVEWTDASFVQYIEKLLAAPVGK